MQDKAMRTQFFCRRLVMITICFLCTNVIAKEEFFLYEFESFGIEENDFDRMQIVPTHMMDTETLFLAAAAERDSSMTMSQRLINNRWLLDESKYSYTGSEALRRYLRMHFIQSWKNRENKKLDSHATVFPAYREQSTSQFKDISNYRLKLSSGKVRVRFKYAFD